VAASVQALFAQGDRRLCERRLLRDTIGDGKLLSQPRSATLQDALAQREISMLTRAATTVHSAGGC